MSTVLKSLGFEVDPGSPDTMYVPLPAFVFSLVSNHNMLYVSLGVCLLQNTFSTSRGWVSTRSLVCTALVPFTSPTVSAPSSPGSAGLLTLHLSLSDRLLIYYGLCQPLCQTFRKRVYSYSQLDTEAPTLKVHHGFVCWLVVDNFD